MTSAEAVNRLKSDIYKYADFQNNPNEDEFWEAFDMAIKALEKDMPKAPKKSDVPRCGMGYEYYDWYCPTCNKLLAFECDTKRQYIHHCECGQRLDWRKYDKRRSDSNY